MEQKAQGPRAGVLQVFKELKEGCTPVGHFALYGSHTAGDLFFSSIEWLLLLFYNNEYGSTMQNWEAQVSTPILQ